MPVTRCFAAEDQRHDPCADMGDGIRQQAADRAGAKHVGNQVENGGAAWMARQLILPGCQLMQHECPPDIKTNRASEYHDHISEQSLTVRVPNMWGKEVENEGAAWMAGKLILPMLSSLVRPKMALMLLNVTHLHAAN